ncbi:MAG: HD domain-containing protein [Deltaproteobacteria bacterium]|nr:HD domain-containing protein [Deltaproteobacteria bacterium]
MKKIRDIREKDQVVGTYLVSKKDVGVSKTGKAYLNIRIMDSTGEMEARVWDDAEAVSRGFNKNDVVSLKGYAVAYQGGVQVNVSSVSALKEGAYTMRDFLPASKRPPEEMLVELDAFIAGIGDVHIKALLEAIFNDAEIRGRFSTAPAAKSMHHPYLGGLLEHVLSLCGLAEKVAGHYGSLIDKDMLVAGVMLHDIGKIDELSYERAFEYTDAGRLLGHITIGIELVDGKIASIEGFPVHKAVLLKHMLLSHHGQLEFGSPKRPKTMEAIVLSYLDDLDAKVTAVKTLIEDGPDDGTGWTPYQRMFERYIYKGAPRGPGHAEATAQARAPLAAPVLKDMAEELNARFAEPKVPASRASHGQSAHASKGGASEPAHKDANPGKQTKPASGADADDKGELKLFK